MVTLSSHDKIVIIILVGKGECRWQSREKQDTGREYVGFQSIEYIKQKSMKHSNAPGYIIERV